MSVGSIAASCWISPVLSGETLHTSASTTPSRWVQESSPSRSFMYASTSVLRPPLVEEFAHEARGLARHAALDLGERGRVRDLGFFLALELGGGRRELLLSRLAVLRDHFSRVSSAAVKIARSSVNLWTM